jgi:malate dehydrogenase (quinone)
VKNVEYLKKRFEALQNQLLRIWFSVLIVIEEWMPLVMEGRDESEK